jgi:ammonia channel protein AmtB
MPIPRGRELVAFALLVVMIVGSFILWLAVPVGWLWVGSKLNQSLDPSFGAYVAIAVGIPATMLVLFTLLRRVDAAHQALTGTLSDAKPVPPPWRRSMRDERNMHAPTSALDIILVATAIAAGLVLLVWFAFFAGSPLPQ